MKKLLLIYTLLGAHAAYGYEYRLQYSPTGAYSITVAGYQLSGSTVAGNCSYTTVTSGSGRDPRSTTNYYYNTCTWDLYGNLLSLTPVSSAPVAPPPISQNGTEIVYAVLGTSTTGQDTRGFGFVNTPSAHYSWQTPSGGYAVIPTTLETITATLVSDGDYSLTTTGAVVKALVSGTYTASAGLATVAANTCTGSVIVGATCSITVNYRPIFIRCTGSPQGYAYTSIDLVPVTNSGASADFTEGFTVTGVRICQD